MSKNLLLLLLLFSIAGLFWEAYGNSSNEGKIKSGNKTSNISRNLNSNDARLNRGISYIPKPILRILNNILTNIYKRIYIHGQPIAQSLISYVIDSLGFFVSSDDTSVAKRRNDNEHYYSQAKNAPGVVSKVSKVFMMPFKKLFGSMRLLPLDAISENAKNMLEPLNELIQHPSVKSLLDIFLIIMENINHLAWDFAKVNVFPPLDKLITKARESEVLPDFILKYLIELQTLYHIFKLLGMA